MHLALQYPYYAYHASITISSFNMIYTFIYLTLHWFTHFIERETQNLTISINQSNLRLLKKIPFWHRHSRGKWIPNQFRSDKMKEKIYPLTTKYLFRPTYTISICISIKYRFNPVLNWFLWDIFTKVTGKELINQGPEHLIQNIFILIWAF